MPVILTTPAEVDQWLDAETSHALALQRPLADDVLRIVAKGKKRGRARREGVRMTTDYAPTRRLSARRQLTLRRAGTSAMGIRRACPSVAPALARLLKGQTDYGGMSRCLLKFSKRSLRIEIYTASA